MKGPLRGTLGDRTGEDALRALATMRASGTLLLETTSPTEPNVEPTEAHYWLGLCERGQSRQVSLGEPLELSATGLHFTFHAHTVTTHALPQFGSRFPAGRAPALRALPALGATHLRAAETDLRVLVARLTRSRFTGTLAVTGEVQGAAWRGVAFLVQGRVGAALAEPLERPFHAALQGGEALQRVLQLADGAAQLELRALPAPIGWGLLGLVAGHTEEERESGVEVSSAGFTFYEAGRTYLFVDAPQDAAAPLGFYPARYNAPALSLPRESPGWEAQRYTLTLRGRDALNPMTDLAMRFSREFGPAERQALAQLASRTSVADAARALRVTPDDLKVYVERLEAESLIRKTER